MTAWKGAVEYIKIQHSACYRTEEIILTDD